jgi:uncharacterized membrane protein YccC
MALIASLRASTRGPILQVVKTSVAAVLAWLVCEFVLQQPLPIFAAIAALLVVQPSVNQSLAKGVERSLGVIAGVLIAYGAGAIFGHASWVVLAVIVVALLLAWLLKLAPGSANQIPISAMLVLAIGAQTPGYAGLRIAETVIGAVIGLVVNALIVPPLLDGPARAAVVALGRAEAGTLTALAIALREPQSRGELETILAQARTLRPLSDAASDSIAKADESLTFNPRAGRHRRSLDLDRALNSRLSILATRIPPMARALRDRYDPSLADDPIVESIALELDRASHDLLLLLPRNDAPERDPEAPPITAELPALTAPLVVAQPHDQTWILVGALLEDLRRVRDEIVGVEE